eukprot:6192473-Pleurochrysis_carterae.AAC.4
MLGKLRRSLPRLLGLSNDRWRVGNVSRGVLWACARRFAALCTRGRCAAAASLDLGPRCSVAAVVSCVTPIRRQYIHAGLLCRLAGCSPDGEVMAGVSERSLAACATPA